ncbi:Zinc finger, RING-type [Dillenia turbinata]|uniref:RING-type E3 ubiquitin transferase n=1 Tax=Dillenia turbinata TaxID=194707 RepID=A0AAN8VK54_9MAGN
MSDAWPHQFSDFGVEFSLSSPLPSAPQSSTLVQLKFSCKRMHKFYSVSEDQTGESIQEIDGEEEFCDFQDVIFEENSVLNPASPAQLLPIYRVLEHFNLRSEFHRTIFDKVIAKVREIFSGLRQGSERQLLNLSVKITDYTFYFRSESEYVYHMGLRLLEEGNFRMIPTKESFVGTLETKVYNMKEAAESCAICLEDFLQEELLKLMPCNHFYHEKCIKKWVEKSRYCPICRCELPI